MMKSRTLATLVGVLFFAVTFGVSSTAFAKKFMIGGKAGANVATVVGDDADSDGSSKKSRVGPAVGAVAAINFGAFGVQPELLYTSRGVKYEADQGDATSTTSANYLQIPVLLRYNIKLPGMPLTPKIMAGPSTSFFLSGKTETEAGGSSDSTDLEGDDMRSPYFSAVFGAGADVGLGPGALLFDLRYERGLSKVNAEPDQGDTPKTFHSVFSAHVGYAIGF